MLEDGVLLPGSGVAEAACERDECSGSPGCDGAPRPPESQIPQIEVTLADAADSEQVGQAWRELQSRSRGSFFTSWGWIGCWLQQLPAGTRPQLLTARCEGRVVGLGILNRTWVSRCRFIPSRGLFLHENGRPDCDLVTVEHNGFLVDGRMESAVHRALLAFVCQQCSGWDELVLSGIDADGALAAVLHEPRRGVRYRTLRQQPCLTVDLDLLRDTGKDFCSTLGSSTRSQVRRSIRLYEADGPVTLSRASTVDEALCAYERLKELHRATWEARGQSGAFAHRCMDEFHRRLIETRHPHGEIDLLAFQAGDRTIGYLYNFVFDGRVMNYQSGFQYEADPKFKPGLVCHCLAIEDARDRGLHVYDFLAGDSRYKQNLGTGDSQMLWSVLQRNRLRFRFEDALRAVRNRIRPRPATGDVDSSSS